MSANADDVIPSSPSSRRAMPLWPMLLVGLVCLIGTAAYFASNYLFHATTSTSSVVSVRPSATLLVAVRDLARLETTELHMEKVIDLTDTQSRFFGLVQGTDAILLVASGNVSIGVDLSKLREDDVSMDAKTKVATLRLPEPEIFSVHLDEKKTYVYRRTTSLIAEPNPQLETQARQQAIASIEKAARETDITDRAKRQAERQLRTLATGLGASSVNVTWR
ncbi:DUF4230 domain-containing protein [Pendulispora brunnea]|uniref:DUF4230 domain-containing protein n=1 Tax=Pendulispora brunnea TaxID=2905690 RepID=A0ABZ2KHN1_9BACT